MNQVSMQNSVKEIEYVLWGVGGLGVLASIWHSVNFATSVLLGVLVIALNFALTKKAVVKILAGESHAKNKMLFLYLLKIGTSAILIYFAIFSFGISAIGLLLGLSSLFVAIVFHTAKRILF